MGFTPGQGTAGTAGTGDNRYYRTPVLSHKAWY